MAEEKEITLTEEPQQQPKGYMVQNKEGKEVFVPFLPEDAEPLNEKETKRREAMFIRMDAYDAQMNERMASVRQAGTQAWAMPKEDCYKNVKAPMIIYTGKDGEMKSYMPRLENVAPLLQTKTEKAQKSNRYVSLNEAKGQGWSIRKGAKTVQMVLYSKKYHARFTQPYLNLDDLAGEKKALAQKVPARAGADRFAQDTVEYLSWREEKGNFTVAQSGKPLSFNDVNRIAVHHASEQKQERKQWAEAQQQQFAVSPEKQAAQERMDTILAAGKAEGKPVDGADLFRRYLAEAYATDKSHYVTMAAEKAMQNDKWTLDNVKQAITKLTPGAAYDATSGKAPYAERIAKYIQQDQQQTKGAAR